MMHPEILRWRWPDESIEVALDWPGDDVTSDEKAGSSIPRASCRVRSQGQELQVSASTRRDHDGQEHIVIFRGTETS
ncbi:hypothetical protein CF319_g8503 [Tilletia indica]|nr:hypothetical protein CF319_g8503 [Tilletia indica]